MIKALYCHGMGGQGITNPKVLMEFKRKGIELISPTINYELYIGNPYLFDLLKELSKDVDMIVGNSMGGFFSYNLSKSTGKPSVNFNPAISPVTTSYNWFNNVTHYEPSENQSKTNIYMSTRDLIVDHEEGREYLNKQPNFIKESDEIEFLYGETHSLSFYTIFNKIVELKNELFGEEEIEISHFLDNYLGNGYIDHDDEDSEH